MNAAKTLSLEPFQDKPQCRPVTAVSIRLPQHYFQSLLSSVSLDWAGNEKAWNVLCCVYIRNNFVLKVWLILLPFGPHFPSCSSPHFFSPLPCFPWANWQQQGFKGDAAWLFRCSELSKNKQLCSCCLLFEAILQPISSEKRAQGRKCRTGNGGLIGEE